MLNPVKVIALLITFGLSSLSWAEIDDQSLNKILISSGITAQVSQFPQLIKQGLNSAARPNQQIPDSVINLMASTVDDSILASDILEAIKLSIKHSLTQDQALQLLRWYESDLGTKITLAELNASSKSAFKQIIKESKSLLLNTKLVDFARRIDTLYAVTDSTMDMQNISGAGIYMVVMTALRPSNRASIAQYNTYLNASRKQLRAAIEQVIILSFVYSYKDLSAQQLSDYEVFLTKKATIKFHRSVVSSMNTQMSISVAKWADSLMLILRQQLHQS
ncbi:MAG: hypothetical protein MJK10_14905 [Pseudomonadales bacterium]|nr:hypothetical protein [Pseudomonadales bacterium]NRA17171.1 hypothetical protein [Oceanospirillaceae bacterium]